MEKLPWKEELQSLENKGYFITSDIFSYFVARSETFEEVIYIKKYLTKLGLKMNEVIYDMLFNLSENYLDSKKVINQMKRHGFTPKDIYYSRMFWKDIYQKDFEKALQYYEKIHKKQAVWDNIHNPTMKHYEILARKELRENLRKKYQSLNGLLKINNSLIKEKYSIPVLEPVNRSREYNLYEDSIRDRVVYESLFHSRTRRWLDEHVIGLNPVESRGYQAMGILHFIGLKDKHKGIFKDLTINEAITLLEEQESDFSLVIQCLQRYKQIDNDDLEKRGGAAAEKYIELESIVTVPPEQIEVTETEKEQVIKSRIGQSTFKKALLEIKKRCKLCGVTDERFLVASHIKPWSKSNNQERLDVNNGLLLCPNHDSLFDKGYISFDDRGRILISDNLDVNTKVFLNINETIKINMNESQQQYMKWHRENIYKF